VSHTLRLGIRADKTVEGSMQQYPIHLDPVCVCPRRPRSQLIYQDGREALRGILSEEGYMDMVKRSAQGTNHGGISITTPGFKRLFQMRQYEGEQPQFIHRWLLREFLSKGVNVQRGRKVVKVEDVNGKGQVKVVFEDGTSDTADLVVGERI
jgi:hypothetical protein